MESVAGGVDKTPLSCIIGSSWKPSGLRGGIVKAILPYFLPLFLACLNGFRIRSPLVQKGFGEIVELIASLAFCKIEHKAL